MRTLWMDVRVAPSTGYRHRVGILWWVYVEEIIKEGLNATSPIYRTGCWVDQMSLWNMEEMLKKKKTLWNVIELPLLWVSLWPMLFSHVDMKLPGFSQRSEPCPFYWWSFLVSKEHVSQLLWWVFFEALAELGMSFTMLRVNVSPDRTVF